MAVAATATLTGLIASAQSLLTVTMPAMGDGTVEGREGDLMIGLDLDVFAIGISTMTTFGGCSAGGVFVTAITLMTIGGFSEGVT